MIEKRYNILVAGNGFDLYHNLPTSYKDFMDVINRILELNFQGKEFSYLSYLLGDNEKNKLNKNNQNIQQCFDTYKNKIKNTLLDIENINKMIDIANKNYWFSYFNSCMQNEIGWIDFELEIKNVLGLFHDFFEKVAEISEEHIKENFILVDVKQLPIQTRIVLNQFYFFRDMAYEDNEVFLENYNFNEWIIINKNYCLKKVVDNKCYIIGIDKSKVTEFLANQLQKFSELFELYIVEVINKISADGSVYSPIFKKIDTVITFNYTDTYKNIYDSNSNIPIEYIHGHAGNANIIFGINSDKHDELETLDVTYISFKKEYKRILNGNLFHYKKIIPKNEKINFIFFGHSLDITDKDILIDLINWENAKCLIYCYDEEAKHIYVRNLFSLFGKSDVEKLLKEEKIEFLFIPELEHKKKRKELFYVTS